MSIAGIRKQFTQHAIFLALVLMLSSGAAPGILRAAEPILDSDVTHYVERAFLSNPTIPFNSIDVTADQGIVTLIGSTGNILAKERAVRTAKE